MHKCFKCGAEFEGKFCPECGTQWQENKHCPNCGAMLAGGAKFCNNCGYSFVESAEEKKPAKEKKPSKVGAFFKKAWAWVRSHLKIVIPTACALIVVIVVCSLIPTFILMGVNGTYYAYSFDENGEIVFNEKTYITLSTGKWTDEEGKEGSYSLSGGEITFTYIDETMEDLGDLFGEDVGPEELKGTVENGVLTVNENGFNRLFVLKSHKHKFGEWEVTKEPTCTEEGEQRHICACRKVDSEKIVPTGHKFDRNHTCEKCGETTNHILNEKNECTLCGNVIADGWEFQYYDFGYIEGYVVIRIGAISGEITIPQSCNGKRVFALGDYAFKDCTSLTSITIPDNIVEIWYCAFEGCSSLSSITIPNGVTSIGDGAFSGCSGLMSVTIPDSVTWIGEYAFYGCTSLTSIKFEGTKAQWKEIYMFFHDNIEDPDTGSFTVQCTDGKLDKNGNEIE